VHPFASVIDTELPKAPSSVHLLLRDKASWVEPQIGPNDDCFDGYPELSIEDWHKKMRCGSNDGALIDTLLDEIITRLRHPERQYSEAPGRQSARIGLRDP
jgi:hypothetical protein